MSFPRSGFSIAPASLAGALATACQRLEAHRFITALWARTVDIWDRDPETQRRIAKRLGWLHALDFITPELPRLRACADSVRRDGFTDIALLGMGGSSLAPEVLRQVYPRAPGAPRFHVLDSVDPDAVRPVMARAGTTLFLLASKSGTTIEPTAIAAEARRRLRLEGHDAWGARFIAITDPDTPLHHSAVANRFRDLFLNPHDIGGRYSALSFFGLLPAALMGLDLDALLAGAREMEAHCRLEQVRDNPGVALGALMAAGAGAGRDKLTLLLPARLQSLGLWVEQLVAESTGKLGKGVVPVVGEPPRLEFGPDRLVVSLSVGNDRPERLDRSIEGNVPGLHIETGEPDLGAEFLRWEIATATAGWLLGINPFDEPNVQQAKEATSTLLASFEQHRQLPFPEAHASVEGARITLSDAARADLEGEPATAFLALLGESSYFGLLAYLPSDDPRWDAALQQFRKAIASRLGCATTLAYGPRYLHSTGQLHKGGPNHGVFLIVIGEPDEDLQVPDQTYSFGVLESAQAVGDFQSLERMGRRVALLRLPRRDPAAFSLATQVLVAALGD